MPTPNIHNDFMRNKITIIGYPKLDNTHYGDKLTEIISHELKKRYCSAYEYPAAAA